MQLTDAQLTYFVDNRLKLPAETREKYLDQVDRLINEFSTAAEREPSIEVVKFLKTGSLVKGTALRPREGIPVDADIAVFLRTARGSRYDLASLHGRLRQMLISAYPTKKSEDFTVQPRTLGIVFRGSGLEVDLVPVIPIEGAGDYGLQPSSEGKPPLRTSIKRQLEFIRSRKELDPRFTRLVQLLKHWRNHQELEESLRSFLIELIVAHLQDTKGPSRSIEEGLLRVFLFIAQTEMRQPITFPENGKPSEIPNDRVVALDPVNDHNNVASRLTTADCNEIIQKATAAWEAITSARNNNFKGETTEFWKGIFGRTFAIEE